MWWSMRLGWLRFLVNLISCWICFVIYFWIFLYKRTKNISVYTLISCFMNNILMSCLFSIIYAQHGTKQRPDAKQAQGSNKETSTFQETFCLSIFQFTMLLLIQQLHRFRFVLKSLRASFYGNISVIVQWIQIFPVTKRLALGMVVLEFEVGLNQCDHRHDVATQNENNPKFAMLWHPCNFNICPDLALLVLVLMPTRSSSIFIFHTWALFEFHCSKLLCR